MSIECIFSTLNGILNNVLPSKNENVDKIFFIDSKRSLNPNKILSIADFIKMFSQTTIFTDKLFELLDEIVGHQSQRKK